MPADKGWSRRFDDPIPLPGGRQPVTLQDAGKYIITAGAPLRSDADASADASPPCRQFRRSTKPAKPIISPSATAPAPPVLRTNCPAARVVAHTNRNFGRFFLGFVLIDFQSRKS
jgi:hypothetical protein